MKIKFAHVNIVSANWRELADFYIRVFGCIPKPPERNLKGRWLDNLTSLENAEIRGIHLLLPGSDENGPTIEIFEYGENKKNINKWINSEGFAHIAFSVENVSDTLKLLIENGGSCVGEVVNAVIDNVGKINVVYARDPEGNIIEIQKWEQKE